MQTFTHLIEDIRQARWVIRLRWTGVGAILAASFLNHLVHPYSFSLVLIMALVVSFYNSLAYLHIRSIEQRGSLAWPGELKVSLNLQVGVDVLMLALAIYWTGGVESAIIAVYLVLLPAAGMVLSRLATFLHTSLALALLGGMYWLEAGGYLPYVSITRPSYPLRYTSLEYISTVWVFQACFLYLGIYIAGFIRTQLQQSYKVEQRARRQAEALRKMAAALGATLDLNQILDLVLKYLRELVTCDGASISLFDGGSIGLAAWWGEPDPACVVEMGMRWAETPIILEAVKKRKPVFDWDVVTDSYPTSYARIRSRALVPLLVRGEVKGILKVHGRRRAMFDDKEVVSIQALAGHVALAVENARMYERTRQMALTDMLTGLYNRHHFYQELERELLRCQRYHHQMTLLMCDLDKFKQYNDRYGHVAGDDLLRNLADTLLRMVRKSDLTFRYGGEEFALILPETPHIYGMDMAERLRAAIQDHVFLNYKDGQATHITISIGVATYPDQAQDVEGLVDAADRALFKAKESRNRVCSIANIRTISSDG